MTKPPDDNLLSQITAALEAAKNLKEENEALRKEVEAFRQKTLILDEFQEFMKQRGSNPSHTNEAGLYSPMAMKRDRRSHLNAYLEAGKHLTQSNKTIAKRFGMSVSNVATIISDMSREGKIKTRPRGRPPEAEVV